MRWYVLVPLIADSRVRFLLGFVVVALIFAGVLTMIELSLKRKKEKQVSEIKERVPIDKMKRYMSSDKGPREKLDFVNKVAKEHFKSAYGTHLNAGYSILASHFDKIGRKKDANFCKEMFATYYSQRDITDEKARALADMLVVIEKEKKRLDEISRVPSFPERVDGFIMMLISGLSKKKKLAKISRIEGKEAKKRERELARQRIINQRQAKRQMDRQYIIARKKEVRVWVKRAIDRGYSREGVLDLLSDGERSLKEVNRVLSFFDKEMGRHKSVSNEEVGLSEGIASRIVREEKNRLNEVVAKKNREIAIVAERVAEERVIIPRKNKKLREVKGGKAVIEKVELERIAQKRRLKNLLIERENLMMQKKIEAKNKKKAEKLGLRN